MKQLLAVVVIAGCGAPPSPPPQPVTSIPAPAAGSATTSPAQPEPPESPRPESVGTANMDDAGILYMRLRSVDHGMVAEALKVVRPADADYKAMVQHLGGIKPGETKSIPPFPDP